jgi:hypothetical protein
MFVMSRPSFSHTDRYVVLRRNFISLEDSTQDILMQINRFLAAGRPARATAL